MVKRITAQDIKNYIKENHNISLLEAKKKLKETQIEQLIKEHNKIIEIIQDFYDIIKILPVKDEEYNFYVRLLDDIEDKFLELKMIEI